VRIVPAVLLSPALLIIVEVLIGIQQSRSGGAFKRMKITRIGYMKDPCRLSSKRHAKKPGCRGEG